MSPSEQLACAVDLRARSRDERVHPRLRKSYLAQGLKMQLDAMVNIEMAETIQRRLDLDKMLIKLFLATFLALIVTAMIY